MKYLAIVVTIALLASQLSSQQLPTFSTTANVVVVNVTVTSRDGTAIGNLGKSDFLLYEDGKLQTLQSCELQKLDTKPLEPILPAKTLQTREAPKPAPAAPAPVAPTKEDLRDRRLIVMLFDISSMQPQEQVRSVDAAIKFLGTQMTTSDMVSIMTFGTDLKTVLDFTADRDQLISTLHAFHVGEASELSTQADTGADAQDISGSFVADETEFNIFNSDRKLAALEDAARRLSHYPEKKALVYISSGIQKTGVDNQSQLQATVNAAIRANVAFYPIDARGLTATAPAGDASQAASVGSNMYSGSAQTSLSDTFHNTQETLDTLAADTGGKALLDSNDLTLGMTQVQKDINSYYMLTYASTNAAEDGKYRRIQVKLAPKAGDLRAKLDYRQGYYAPTTFAKMTGTNKEAQLQEALESDNPVTDLPIAVEVDYFRLGKGKYFVPISVRIPGSALAFRNKGAKAATEMDFIGEVRDARGRQASAVRDTIPLKVASTTVGEVTRKQIQYDTGFTLGPGKYTLKFVARENGEGKAGTFQAPFVVPDLGSGNTLRLSSVILSNQVQAVKEQIAGAKNSKKLVAEDPLIDDAGQKIMPNVTRVFRPGQKLSVYLELYDPGVMQFPAQSQGQNQGQGAGIASVTATVAFYQGDKKVMETPAVRVNRINAKRQGVVPLRLQTLLKTLPAGEYVCQVNVIDQLGHKFAFPRSSIVVLADEADSKPPAPADPARKTG
ncbi:MAG: VWA domain-containing protein [Bryobacteraceae bacterium]